MSHWLQRIGQSDADTFLSLIAKMGNNTTAFWTAIGYEGATSLAAKLTAARAALLDQITALRMAELDAANLPADIDTLLTRLTALRAGYLDNLSAGAVALNADIVTLLARLTALRAGYLDNLSAGAVAQASAWTAALATALGAYTAARGGYLDNINQAGLLQVTAARAALLDQITALRLAELDAANIPADIDTLLALAGTMPTWGAEQSGTLAATGAEDQILLTNEAEDFELYCDIDLVNMAGGDTTVIRVYKRVDGVTLRLADEQTFVGAQTILVYSIGPEKGSLAMDIQVTLQQTAGVMRNYPWRWNRK